MLSKYDDSTDRDKRASEGGRAEESISDILDTSFDFDQSTTERQTWLYDPAAEDNGIFGSGTSPDLDFPPSPIQQQPKISPDDGSDTLRQHRERLVRFYSEYNPEKVGQVEHILSQWRGQEAEMFICLEQKYGLDV